MSYNADETHAEDARHDTPYVGRHDTEPVNPFRLPERGKEQGYVVPEAFSFSRVSEDPPMEVELSHGLTWTFAPGQKLMDLGRISTEVVTEMHTLDLRVMMAHLDSAASKIKTELDKRYSAGTL